MIIKHKKVGLSLALGSERVQNTLIFRHHEVGLSLGAEMVDNQTQQNGFNKSDQGSNTTNASLSVDVPDIFIPTTTDTTNSTDDSQWENSTAIVVTP